MKKHVKIENSITMTKNKLPENCSGFSPHGAQCRGGAVFNRILRICKPTAWFGIVLLGFSIASAETPPSKETGAEQNLLDNPSFEETLQQTLPPEDVARVPDVPGVFEVPKGYGINGAYPGKITVINDPKSAHSGSRYVKLEQCARTPYVAFCHNKRFKVNAGDSYRGSIWAKGAGAVEVMLYCYANSKFVRTTDAGGSFVVETNEWQKHEWKFTVPEDVELFVLAFHVKGEARFDDVELVQCH